ncbi:MAG TPA: hypothetical protein VFI25_14545 [Planctomycetota bacterium]|nr:hypothetical protein [Planctomycetota bacterium]
MKDCDRIAGELLYRADGVGRSGGAAALEAHVAGCSTCAARERDARARIALLRSLPRAPVPGSLDRAVSAEIEALGTAPVEARSRFVSRWIARLARIPVPVALDERVRGEIRGASPVGRVRLLRFSAVASAAAAVLVAAWTLLFSGEGGTRTASFVVREVSPEAFRNPVALDLASGLSGAPAAGEKR